MFQELKSLKNFNFLA